MAVHQTARIHTLLLQLCPPPAEVLDSLTLDPCPMLTPPALSLPLSLALADAQSHGRSWLLELVTMEAS